MAWTKEKEELLRKLWAEGLSASQISKELGGVSRSGVIGKVHRLKLAKRGMATNNLNRHKEGARKASTKRTYAPRKAKQLVSSVAMVPYLPPPAKPNVRLESAVMAVPVSRGLKIGDLTQHTCKWPIGDPLTEDFNFCGHDTVTTSYCPYHQRIASQPATARR